MELGIWWQLGGILQEAKQKFLQKARVVTGQREVELGLYIETSKDSAECNILIYLYSWFYIDPHLTFISDLFKKHLLLHRLCGILQFITNLF